uniref:Uncharacterized protein n=1 Tax=Nitzschia sp. PL3-2 TaxID=2083271 RepID=A0A2Z5ZAR0_9STRA|nr:hypothetical protein [Nitzschia sp. PL3-2]
MKFFFKLIYTGFINNLFLIFIFFKIIWKNLNNLLKAQRLIIKKKILNSEIIFFKARLSYYFFYEKLFKIINKIKKIKYKTFFYNKNILKIKLFIIKNYIINIYKNITQSFLVEEYQFYLNIINNIIFILLKKIKYKLVN